MFNLLEEVTIPKGIQEPPPRKAISVGPPFVVAMHWSRTKVGVAESAEARLRVFAPNESKEVGGSLIKIDLDGNVTRTRQIVNIPFLPYRRPGEYQFEVQIKAGTKWRRVGGASLTVKAPTP